MLQEVSFEAFAEKWEPEYPAMVQTWRDTWDDFEPFGELPTELRKIVYSHQRYRKPQRQVSVKQQYGKAIPRPSTPGVKVLHLTSIERKKDRKNPTGQAHGQKPIHRADRLKQTNYQPPPPLTQQKLQSHAGSKKLGH